MKNKLRYLMTMLVVVFAMVAVCGCGDDDDDASRGTSISSEYVEKSKYADDVSNLDSVRTALLTYAADPNSKYSSGSVYTLTELLRKDDNNIMKPILFETFNIEGETGTFNATSKAFKGITTDDVLVCIARNGSASVYVPSQSKEYDDYKCGNVEELVQYR